MIKGTSFKRVALALFRKDFYFLEGVGMCGCYDV